MTIGMADTMMVTSVGEHAVSGVSLVDNISILLINIFSALATGARWWPRNTWGPGMSPMPALPPSSFLCHCGSLHCYDGRLPSFREPILRLVFGTLDDDVMTAAMTYFLLTSISYPFLAIYNAGAALFRSMGNSKVSMFASLLMNIVNIGLNAVLIYGVGIGVAGAGFGTLASRLVGALLMTWLICQPHNPIHISGLFRPEFQNQLVKRFSASASPTAWKMVCSRSGS